MTDMWGQGPGQGPGYGPGYGPGGYGWGAWPPPPPQPGVIPLAPLGADRILGGAFTTMRRHAKPLFGTVLIVYVVLAALVAGALALAYAAVSDDVRALLDRHTEFEWSHARPVFTAFGVVWAVGMLALTAGTAFIQSACTVVLREAVLGRPARFGAVWRRAWSRTPSVLGVGLLMGLIALIPAGLAVAFFVSIFVMLLTQSLAPVGVLFLLMAVTAPLVVWVYVLFMFGPAAATLEEAGPIQALRRSARLVRGAWWRTFGISLLAGAIMMVVSLAVRVPLQIAMPDTTPQAYEPGQSASDVFEAMLPQLGFVMALSMIANLLVQLVSSVFLPLVTALLYIDQRIRREGLAHTLELASRSDA
ncbi:oxidoreductase [Streptomyces sp. CB01635]|uniref:DUF7847 domain-containing protein n=1 Tax=Streptomyces sp. CB01635 TaxID=2020326 RepID=UPI000CAFC3B5|nr:oxidoreductase [Streptomyces sp. CB01635]PJN12823.1 oxidoreductase [Streptomyces sp. CB01635]